LLTDSDFEDNNLRISGIDDAAECLKCGNHIGYTPKVTAQN